jgi:hypothetical protein
VLSGSLDASYDHYFYVGAPGPEDMTETERLQRIDNEIERLASPAWEMARENLFKLGRHAIDRLILNLDRTEVSSASVRPVPGPTLPEQQQTWPMGYVVYTVLVDFIGGYSNYVGTDLPGFNKRDWRDWWSDNSGDIVVYEAESTAPHYVRVQLAEAREALSSRFATISAAARERESAAKAKGKEGRGRKKERRAEERPPKAERKAPERRRGRPEPGPAKEAVEEAEEIRGAEEIPEPKKGRSRRRGRRKEEEAVEESTRVEPEEKLEEPREEAKGEPKREVEEKGKEEGAKDEVKEEVKEESKPEKEEKKPSRRRRRKRTK